MSTRIFVENPQQVWGEIRQLMLVYGTGVAGVYLKEFHKKYPELYRLYFSIGIHKAEFKLDEVK